MRIRQFLHRRRWDRERTKEIESYLEIETAENISRGMTPADAAAAARKKFGNPVLIREEIYRMNSIAWLESASQDLRYGWRVLRLSPAFAAVAIVSLALGIGANTAIFQLLDAVRLRSLPVERPHELAEIRIVGGNKGLGLNNGAYAQLTRPLWYEIRDHQKAFSGVFAWGVNDVRIGEGAAKQDAAAMQVSGEFFEVLGVKPWRGVLLTPADADGTCPESRAMVSYSYWQSHMGGRALSSESKLLVDGEMWQVVGVTPPGFFGLVVGDTFDIALPFCRPKALQRNLFDIAVMGRLRPGWTLERASSHLAAISPGLLEDTVPPGYSSATEERYKHFRLGAYPAAGGVSMLRMTYDSSLWLLLAITGLVLLIACANLANLMLARASAREREIAVRLALGASRGRLVRQLLAESALLAVSGAVLGIGLAQALSRVLVWSLSTSMGSVVLSLDTDWRVLLFATLVAGATCAVFGVVPAFRATNAEPASAMKAGGRGMTAGRERFSLQRLMVVAQIAVSLVLLVSALLFVRSFRNLMTFDPGMREDGITVAFLGYWESHIAPERWGEVQRELLDEVRSIPGVESVASTTNVPLLGGSWTHTIHIGSSEGESKFAWVSPGYLHTMGITLLKGRDIEPGDTKTSRRVALVNETFVRRYLGAVSPIGQTLRTFPEPDYPSTVYEIVGVIADTRYSDVRGDTPPMALAPATQFPAQGPWTSLMVRSSLASAAAIAAVEHRIAEKYPDMITDFLDFKTRIRDGMTRDRLMAILSGFFGLLAAVLAMVGLYGVISYIVARRRNEIGIRMALGAHRGQVIAMVMREAGRMLAIGVAAGTVLALIAGRSVGALLFGLKPYDPATLGAAAALLATVAALASFLPARRASKLDPITALRYE